VLPQTGQVPIFRINTGRILLVQILGEVTTAIQNQLDNARLIHNVTTGTDQDLCAILNIANDEVGTLYGISGVFADALIGSGQTMQRMQRELILKPGTIDFHCSANNTGNVKWSLYWSPLDRGAYATAV
jgi:hypothetical protein